MVVEAIITQGNTPILKTILLVMWKVKHANNARGLNILIYSAKCRNVSKRSPQ